MTLPRSITVSAPCILCDGQGVLPGTRTYVATNDAGEDETRVGADLPCCGSGKIPGGYRVGVLTSPIWGTADEGFVDVMVDLDIDFAVHHIEATVDIRSLTKDQGDDTIDATVDGEPATPWAAEVARLAVRELARLKVADGKNYGGGGGGL